MPKLQKLLLNQAQFSTGEQNFYAQPAMGECVHETEGNSVRTKPDTVLNGHPVTHLQNYDELCKHCEENNRRLRCETALTFPETSSEEEEVQNYPKSVFEWHWTNDPIKPEGKDNEYVILKFTTKERFTKFNTTKASKKPNTPHAAPEIGDVRRFYETKQQRYVTALIISAKNIPSTEENLQLGLWNLHSQMQTLGAKKLHIPMPQKATKPLPEFKILLALEQQFIKSEIKIHLWFPEERDPFLI